ncbi:MAG TPA: hypothetical protein PKK06_05805 [Phycisphaerae bacterium]|nr:hypothetical protein [Phycisphaerae bacterium]HNU44290.1 hypothetical protein [Phycisphaerae bacterium]
MPGKRKTANRSTISKRQLAALVEEATVDCYNESEAVCGFYTKIADHLEAPFATVVLGVDVEVARVELTRQEEIVAVCVRGKERQRIPICDLPLPSPPPAGAEWIEAYRHWAAGA